MKRKELAVDSAPTVSLPMATRIDFLEAAKAGIKISGSQTLAMNAKHSSAMTKKTGWDLLREGDLIGKLCTGFGLELISNLFERAVRIDGRPLCHRAPTEYASPYGEVALGRAVGVYSSLGSFSILFASAIAGGITSIQNKLSSSRKLRYRSSPSLTVQRLGNCSNTNLSLPKRKADVSDMKGKPTTSQFF